MAWCEATKVDYLFGVARNERLVAELEVTMARPPRQSQETGKPARRFKDFRYTTLDSWSRERRVIGKAEWTQDEADPRL